VETGRKTFVYLLALLGITKNFYCRDRTQLVNAVGVGATQVRDESSLSSNTYVYIYIYVGSWLFSLSPLIGYVIEPVSIAQGVIA